jgi:hypothetical protein
MRVSVKYNEPHCTRQRNIFILDRGYSQFAMICMDRISKKMPEERIQLDIL